MKHTRDSRRPGEAATEKNAVPGGDSADNIKEAVGGGTQGSGAPRSWKQYIDQAMPAREAEQAQAEAGPNVAEEANAVWAKFLQRVKQVGGIVKSAAGTCRGKVSGFAAGSWGKAGQGAGKLRNVMARHPISPLLYATVLAMGIGWVAFKGTYVRAYAMQVNGQPVGLVSSEDEANAIVDSVETRVSSILGESYDYEAKVTLDPVYTVPNALSDAAEVEDTLFDGVGAYIQAYAISVDGEELGYAAGKDELYRMLDELAQPYIPENAIRYEFVEDVQIYPVELPSNTQFDTASIRDELSALRVEEAVYVVEKGDTFNAIAYSLDMVPDELSALNPDVIVNKLWVGQELVIQRAVPRLSVQVVADETYEEVIPSPVEYIETADLYVGDSKVKEQGEDGLAQINAQVTYVNNVEQEREILQTTTIKEATTTYTYTGTTPRPVTASTGRYIWPVRGRITSNFGYRSVSVGSSYHKGIDIACPTGTSVKAADGGTVIKAGWEGTYGKLVAIRHDNGNVTYYAHNSSLLVSVGDKVYQGQVIARAGSTGRSTGSHCHFEIRINGTCVNPRNYLP